MHGFDRVVEGDRSVRRNEVRDLQVITPALGPDERWHTEHAAPDGLRVLAGQRREICRFEVLLPAGDVQARPLSRDPMGRMLIEWQGIFAARPLQAAARDMSLPLAPA